MAQFVQEHCRYCGSLAMPDHRPGAGPHYEGVWCVDCHRHLRWVPWPKDLSLDARLDLLLADDRQ